jgi:hypothetical protein
MRGAVMERDWHPLPARVEWVNGLFAKELCGVFAEQTIPLPPKNGGTATCVAERARQLTFPIMRSTKNVSVSSGSRSTRFFGIFCCCRSWRGCLREFCGRNYVRVHVILHQCVNYPKNHNNNFNILWNLGIIHFNF